MFFQVFPDLETIPSTINHKNSFWLMPAQIVYTMYQKIDISIDIFVNVPTKWCMYQGIKAFHLKDNWKIILTLNFIAAKCHKSGGLSTK